MKMEQSTDLRKANRELWWFGLLKIPLIFFCRPKLVHLDADKLIMKIPLNRRTRNHLGSMYFGTFAVGADIAGGFQAFSIARNNRLKMSLVFGKFEAEFLKRAESDVFFECSEGKQIKELIERAMRSRDRENHEVQIEAYSHTNGQKEMVALFRLVLSIRIRE